MIREISLEVLLSGFCYYLPIVPVSLTNVIECTVVDDPVLIHHALLPLFLIIQKYSIS